MARDKGLSRRARNVAMALLALAFLGASGVGAAAPGYKGRALIDVLRQLQDDSLQFLYSNDLVKDSMVVGREPATRDRLGIAREVLAEQGLEIRSVSPTLYIVVRRQSDQRLRKISGRVLDATSDLPLSGARIELVPLRRVTWSDRSGDFAFDRLAAGEDYRLIATIEDYARGETMVRIQAADAAATDGTIRLQRVPLETVVVETSRYALAVESANGAQQLDAVDLANQPDIADDPIRALRRVPGVIQGGLSAASNLRGGETNEVLVLLDGFPLRQLYHLPGYQSPFSLLDEDLVDSIQVFTGGFPARYGNRLAGVFDITSADAGAAPRTSVGLSFFNAHARNAGETADGDTDWRAAARFGTMRPVLQYLSVDGGRPGYSDLSLAGSHRMSEQLLLSANFLWAADEYSLDDDDEHAEIESRTRYSWLRADYQPLDDVTTSFWFGHTSLTIDRGGAVDKPEFSTGAVSDHRDTGYWDARGNLNWQWNERSRLNAGFEWSQGRANYRYDSTVRFASALAGLFGREETFARSASLEPGQRRAALFVSQRWKLGERWMPEIGLRTQELRIGSTHERTWDPRVGIRWEIRPRTGLRAHWGRFHQADEIHELAVADGVTAFDRAQRAEHLILGIEHRFANGVALRAEAFRKQQRHPRARFENLMSPIEVFAEIAPDRVRVAPDEARMRGAEFSLAVERDSWRGWSAISVARAYDDFGADQVPRSWDQRLAWSSGFDWHRGQWRIGATATMRSGWPATPVGFTSDGDATLGRRNDDRMPAFASLDFRAEYRRPLAVGSLSIALEVANLTNRRNQCCVDVEVEDIDTPDESIVVEQQFWPRLLPSLSIQWEL
jgi:outer membrane cobalamin receptor